MTASVETSAIEQALARLEELGAEFSLPDYVAENSPELVVLYVDYIDKLRSEAMGLPMHTVQQFLLERIATSYVLIRYAESRNQWEGRNPKVTQDAWLDLVKEWNKVLASGQDKLRSAVLQDAERIAIEAIQLVEDEQTRKRLRLHFKESFTALGY